MKYRLKDRELQKKLDEISGGEFSKNLHQFDDDHFSSAWGKKIHFTEKEDDDGEELEEPRSYDQPQFGAFFNANEVETVPEYDPHKWNRWPGVTPPEGVLMRAEIYAPGTFDGPESKPERLVARYGLYWYGKEWGDEAHGLPYLNGYIVRFRPWEDDE